MFFSGWGWGRENWFFVEVGVGERGWGEVFDIDIVLG